METGLEPVTPRLKTECSTIELLHIIAERIGIEPTSRKMATVFKTACTHVHYSPLVPVRGIEPLSFGRKPNELTTVLYGHKKSLLN